MELNDAITDTNSIWRVSTGLLVTEMVTGRVQTGVDKFTARKPSEAVIAGDYQAATNPRYADFQAAASKTATDLTSQVAKGVLPAHFATDKQVPTSVEYARFVAETGHNIANVFWSYMLQPASGANPGVVGGSSPLFDWLYVMGYPITEPFWCSVRIDGKEQIVLIQLFQRRVLTYVPAYAAGWQVQMGNTGQHYFNWRYSDASTGQPDTQGGASPLPTLVPADGGFVGVQGSSFVYGENAVKLKGTNYWLSQAPFVGTWSEWNGPRAALELEKAHELGANAVRVGIPYDHRDTMDVVWGNTDRMVTVSPWIKNQMTQFLQIASSYNMKVIFVLFEWYDTYPPQGSKDEQTNLAYLQGIVGTFANDDRVVAWDIHNEPDFYDGWQRGSQDEVIDWLRRMSAAIRGLDKRHPITVGVGNYSSLWYPTSSGTTILSFVDFAAFHTYDAGALAGQATAIKAHTNKPVLLEEMGWPTNLGGEKPRENAVFDEATQQFLYKTMLADSKSADLAGVFQWTLWDYWGGQTHLVPGHERYFGLVRSDGTFKPAAQTFRDDYTGPPLPSKTFSNVPLDTSDRPNVKP
jgi:hypothetical protein